AQQKSHISPIQFGRYYCRVVAVLVGARGSAATSTMGRESSACPGGDSPLDDRDGQLAANSGNVELEAQATASVSRFEVRIPLLGTQRGGRRAEGALVAGWRRRWRARPQSVGPSAKNEGLGGAGGRRHTGPYLAGAGVSWMGLPTGSAACSPEPRPE